MNKLFTSIAAISLGLTMAIGVGAAVGASAASKDAVEAKAVPSAGTTSYNLAFSNIGTTGWGSSYANHTYTAGDGVVITMNGSSKQTGTITDIPVTKGGQVTLVLPTNPGVYISAFTFNARQWTTKTQTITAHYSTDGGSTYTAISGTSTNFTISKSSLTEGTNAIKITFSSSSNQVGLSDFSVTYTAAAIKTVTGLEVLDDNLNELSDGDTVNLTASSSTVTTDIACEVTYQTGSPDGDVTITSNPSLGFSYSTSDHSVYTLSFAAEDDFDVTIASTIDDNFAITVTYHVTGIVQVKYSKITSTSSIKDGSQIIIGSTDGTHVSAKYVSGNNCSGLTNVPDGSGDLVEALLPSGYALFTVTGSASGWTLTDQDGLIYYGESGNNRFKASSSATDTWTIAVNSSGVATITSAASSRALRFNENSGSPIFNTYASGQNDVSIYMIPTAEKCITVEVTGSISLGVGETATLTATKHNGATGTVGWATSNSSILSISSATGDSITVTAGSTTGSATITASLTGCDDVETAFTVRKGSATVPYTVAEAIAAIDGSDAGAKTSVYTSGIISQVSTLNSDNSITYYISDNGTTTDQMEIYKGFGLNGATFSSVDDLQVGDEVVVFGNLSKYGSTYEYAAGNKLHSFNRPSKVLASITAIEGTLSAVAGDPAWDLSTLVVKGTMQGSADVVVVTMYVDLTTSDVPGTPSSTTTRNVSVTATGKDDSSITLTANVSGTITAYSGLVADGNYRIKATRNSVTYYLKENGTSAAPSAVTDFKEATVFTFEKVADNTYTISHGGNYLYCTATNNGVRFSNTSTATEDRWTISAGEGTLTGSYNLYSASGSRFLTLYAATDSDPSDWRGYTSATGTNRKENTDLQAFDATQYATEFLSTYTAGCNYSEGGYNPEGMDWATAETQFGYLSSAEQEVMRTADHIETGTTIEHAAYLYDYIIIKYGTATFKDFMTRSPSSLIKSNTLFTTSTDNIIPIIVIISLISVSAIGGYFYIRRRKEQ